MSNLLCSSPDYHPRSPLSQLLLSQPRTATSWASTHTRPRSKEGRIRTPASNQMRSVLEFLEREDVVSDHSGYAGTLPSVYTGAHTSVHIPTLPLCFCLGGLLHASPPSHFGWKHSPWCLHSTHVSELTWHCFLNRVASDCVTVLAADSRDSTSSLGCSESVTKCTLSGLRGHTEHRRANAVFVVWFSLPFCLSQIKFS